MAMDRSKYPENWEEISRQIRFERAAGKCEQCGVAHGAEIIREPGTDRFWYHDLQMLMDSGLVRDASGSLVNYYELPEDFVDWKVTRVILTVHHIGVPKDDGSPGSPHDKMDCRDQNLIALCQRCHLLADMPEHVKASKKTRTRNKHDAIKANGQKAMFGGLHETGN